MEFSLVHDCPHCLMSDVGFNFIGGTPVAKEGVKFAFFYLCNSCHRPLSVIIKQRSTLQDIVLSNEYRSNDKARDLKRVFHPSSLEFFPKPYEYKIPNHLPPLIASAFKEAEDAIGTGVKKGRWNSAAAMDRRALELATKEMAAEKADASLYQRIEYLADTGQLTPSLKEWAHSLRCLGNDAAHEARNVQADEAQHAHDLTRFILLYLYTLPENVRLARERK